MTRIPQRAVRPAVPVETTPGPVAPGDTAQSNREDWLAVAIAATVIVLVWAGVGPAAPVFGWVSGLDLFGAVFGPGNLWRSLQLALLLMVPSALGAAVMGVSSGLFVRGFLVLYALGWVSQVMAGAGPAAAVGLEYVIFALGIGLALGRVGSFRRWLGGALQAEYYIKIGLVVLGSSVLFGEIVNAGLLGLAQAVSVVLAVWFFCFWLARRLGVDDELATMLSTAVSICGVSAAIAACGAIQGDRRKLSYVTSLVLVVAVPMMVLMPLVAGLAGIPDIVAGAWLGGTLDTSAAVVAGGELISPQARNAAVVVKLSQNVLIGAAAFLLTVWWSVGRRDAANPRTGVGIVWERFPKFVLGFLLVSLVFSFLVADADIAATRGLLAAVRTAWFAMAFVAIGLETSASELVTTGGGRPALAFLGAQAFNLIVTLVAAYLLFGGLLFAVPDLS